MRAHLRVMLDAEPREGQVGILTLPSLLAPEIVVVAIGEAQPYEKQGRFLRFEIEVRVESPSWMSAIERVCPGAIALGPGELLWDRRSQPASNWPELYWLHIELLDVEAVAE